MPAVPYSDARAAIGPLFRALERVTERVAVVGSLRRREPVAGSVEVLVRPRTGPSDLFGGTSDDLAAVQAVLRDWGDVTRDSGRLLEAVARGSTPLRVSVTLVPRDATWAWLLLRGTGPARFVAHVQRHLERHGVHCSVDGSQLRDAGGALLTLDEESEVFTLAALPPTPPEHRVAQTFDDADGDHQRPTLHEARPSKERGQHQGRGMTIERDEEH